MVLISVVIATKNRPKDLKNCLKAILRNKFKNFEVVVVDQSKNKESEKIIKSFRSKRIIYKHQRKEGKSYALNYGIKISKGKLIAFTDDDCIVSKDWLKNIFSSFKRNKYIYGVFGNTLPYRKQFHKDESCPSRIVVKKYSMFKIPVVHWEKIGNGNNMAFRKEVFEMLGYFKEWLSTGTYSYSGEDSEFVNRLLYRGFSVSHDPSVLVYHNSWLTYKEYRLKKLHYLCGMMASYGYLGLKGVDIGKKVVARHIYFTKENLKGDIIKFIKIKNFSLQEFIYHLKELFYLSKGLFIAFIHRRENHI